VHLTSLSLNSLATDVAFALRPAWLTGTSLWLNLWAVALFVFGLVVTLRRNQPPATGADRIIRFGPMFFAVPLGFFGMQHFALFEAVKPAVPDWMPWPSFWTYFVGAALIAACLSILTDIKADLAGWALGIMFVLFLLMIYLPNLIENPHDRFAISNPLRDLSLCVGALALAVALTRTRTKARSSEGRQQRLLGLATAVRLIFGATIIYFGVEQFLHPEFAPGVPLEMLTAPWMPGRIAWSCFAGIVLVADGLCILANRRARWSATGVGVLYVLLVAFVYMPMEIAHPSVEISGELDFVASTLAVGGAALLVAGALE
jgi:uncharacterized membrane protein